MTIQERQIIPGWGYYAIIVDDEFGHWPYFPDALLIEIDDDDECILTGLGNGITVDYDEDYVNTCNLIAFEELLKDAVKANGSTEQYEAERLIYEFEAHRVKLHPEIYRKYQPNKKQ